MLDEVGSGEHTAEERRRRHVQHLLGGCACRQYTTAAEGHVRRVPTLSGLRADLLAALPVSRAIAMRVTIVCATTGCPQGVRAGFVPLFLDPLLFLRDGVSDTAAPLDRDVAAYVVYVSAMRARETVDLSRLEARRLPGETNMARASPFCAIDWGSDDEFGCTPLPRPLIRPLRPHSPHPIRARGREAVALRVRRDRRQPFLFSRGRIGWGKWGRTS